MRYSIKQLLDVKMLIEAKMSPEGANAAGKILAVGIAASSVICAVAFSISLIVPLVR